MHARTCTQIPSIFLMFLTIFFLFRTLFFKHFLMTFFLFFVSFLCRQLKWKNHYRDHRANVNRWTFRWKRRSCSKTKSSWTTSIRLKCYWPSISARMRTMAFGRGRVRLEHHPQNIYLICHSPCQRRYRISAKSHQFYRIRSVLFASPNANAMNNPTNRMWRWRHATVAPNRPPATSKWTQSMVNMRAVNEIVHWQWMWKSKRSGRKRHPMSHIRPNHALHPVPQALETQRLTSIQHQMRRQSGAFRQIQSKSANLFANHFVCNLIK